MRVETKIKIPAPPARVWTALCDFPAYSRWNPFRGVIGSPQLGAKVTLLIGPNPEARHKLPARIGLLEPGRTIGFVTGRKLFGLATETFTVESHGAGTLLRHSVTMSGLNALFMGRKGAADDLVQVYQNVDRALRAYCTTPSRRTPSRRR